MKKVKHGGWSNGQREALYTIFHAMHDRCRREKGTAYRYYGGRGIRVCDGWRDYPAFRSWAMSNGYRPGLTIDRRDSDGDYTPENCRWVTMAVQCRNTSRNRMLTAFGETKCLTDWASDSRCMVSVAVLTKRVNAGWESESAVLCGGKP